METPAAQNTEAAQRWPAHTPSPEFAAWLAYAAANRERLQQAMPGQPAASVTSTLALHFAALTEEERRDWASRALSTTQTDEQANEVCRQRAANPQ